MDAQSELAHLAERKTTRAVDLFAALVSLQLIAQRQTQQTNDKMRWEAPELTG